MSGPLSVFVWQWNMFKVKSINLSKLLTNESVPLTKLDEVKLCLYYIYIVQKCTYIVMFLCTYVYSDENKDIVLHVSVKTGTY